MSILFTNENTKSRFSAIENSVLFFWINKRKILVGFVEDKKILTGNSDGRKKDSVVTMEIDPLADIPIEVIKQNFVQQINKYNLAF